MVPIFMTSEAQNVVLNAYFWRLKRTFLMRKIQPLVITHGPVIFLQ